MPGNRCYGKHGQPAGLSEAMSIGSQGGLGDVPSQWQIQQGQSVLAEAVCGQGCCHPSLAMKVGCLAGSRAKEVQ